jgi:hypothetical protein
MVHGVAVWAIEALLLEFFDHNRTLHVEHTSDEGGVKHSVALDEE